MASLSDAQFRRLMLQERDLLKGSTLVLEELNYKGKEAYLNFFEISKGQRCGASAWKLDPTKEAVRAACEVLYGFPNQDEADSFFTSVFLAKCLRKETGVPQEKIRPVGGDRMDVWENVLTEKGTQVRCYEYLVSVGRMAMLITLAGIDGAIDFKDTIDLAKAGVSRVREGLENPTEVTKERPAPASPARDKLGKAFDFPVGTVWQYDMLVTGRTERLSLTLKSKVAGKSNLRPSNEDQDFKLFVEDGILHWGHRGIELAPIFKLGSTKGETWGVTADTMRCRFDAEHQGMEQITVLYGEVKDVAHTTVIADYGGRGATTMNFYVKEGMGIVKAEIEGLWTMELVGMDVPGK